MIPHYIVRFIPNILLIPKQHWFWPPLSFSLNFSTIATYIFKILTCTYSIIILEPCALNVEFQHFMPNFHYFADPTKRGVWSWKETRGQGENNVILLKTMLWNFFYFSKGSHIIYIYIKGWSWDGSWERLEVQKQPRNVLFQKIKRFCWSHS